MLQAASGLPAESAPTQPPCTHFIPLQRGLGVEKGGREEDNKPGHLGVGEAETWKFPHAPDQETVNCRGQGPRAGGPGHGGGAWRPSEIRKAGLK